LTVGVLWLGLHEGAGVWAFPVSGAAALFVTLPLAVALIRRRVSPIRFFSFRFDAEFRSYFERFKREAWSCFRSELATLVLFSVDIILVGLMCGYEDAAAYGVLSRMFGIVRAFVQASGEAAWPFVAQHGLQKRSFGQQLIRINAWTYGSITGVACVVLYPFLQWFMGEQWIASRTVLYAVALRFLVTGMASNVTYLLYGLGQFQDLRRNLERELCASVVLAVVLGPAFGVNGISVAFLAATSFGTLFPMIHVCARQVAMPAWKLMGDMWWRALAALFSAAFTSVLLRNFSSGIQFVGIGLVGVLAAIAVGYSISFLRFRGDSEGPLLRHRVFFYLKNM
jgi:O-antigen/teichoic acid export membrane protein